VERSIVLLHGMTNSPIQFKALAPQFFDLGYNVLLPRLPHHGYKNRMTEALKNLTVDELKQCGNESIDAAAGLGDQVTIAGLSLGGVVALWMGQTRPDVHTAIAIAPALALKGISAEVQEVIANGLQVMPNVFSWWDPRVGANLEPEHVYPRFATRALASSYRLGAELLKSSKKQKPCAERLVVIVSNGDPSVNNALGKRIIDNWRARGANAEFNAPDWGIIHDIIDPAQSYAMIDKVYPVIIPMMRGE
jgi:pimeloyl-ACP methyl ester carboxylesterase